jgi:hypothetical protein
MRQLPNGKVASLYPSRTLFPTLPKSRICNGKCNIQKEEDATSKLDLNLRKELVKCYIWSTAWYGAGTGTLRKVYQKYLEVFEM